MPIVARVTRAGGECRRQHRLRKWGVEHPMSAAPSERTRIAHFIRVMSVPLVLVWLALTVISNVAVPQLEEVGKAHSVSMNAHDAPSFIAMQRIGEVFDEFDSDSNAMIILEGDKPLGADAHHYYDGLIAKLRADPHVQ